MGTEFKRFEEKTKFLEIFATDDLGNSERTLVPGLGDAARLSRMAVRYGLYFRQRGS